MLRNLLLLFFPTPVFSSTITYKSVSPPIPGKLLDPQSLVLRFLMRGMMVNSAAGSSLSAKGYEQRASEPTTADQDPAALGLKPLQDLQTLLLNLHAFPDV